MTTQFELAHCELYHPHIHGEVYNEDQPYDTPFHDKDYIYSSYLYHGNITLDEFYDDDYIIDIGHYPNPPHPFVRNWDQAIKPYSMQIVKRIDHGYYTLCIVKTIWLKIIQRKWKRYYHSMLAKRKNPRNLMYRQITGKWKN
jgi:hypothetical protein